MPSSLLRVGWRYWTRRVWQSGLAILGIALGVAVVVAIDLANGSARRAFALSTEAVSGRATHQVVGGPLGLDEAVYRQLRLDLGIRQSAPVVEGYATAVSLDRQPLRILGVDPFAEAPFRPYLTTRDAAATGDLSRFLVQPGAVLVSEGFAQARGLKVGDSIALRVGGARKTVTIVGLLRPSDSTSQRALDGLLLTDISTAQETLDMVARLSHIDLLGQTTDGDTRFATPTGTLTLAQVADALPAGVRVVRAEARSQAIEQLTSAFELNLTALSLLALVVGMFLIYNTMTFSVIQRRPMLGTLRALGVTREEIGRGIFLEAVILSTLGGILGLGLGVVLGRGAVRLVTQTISDLYFVVTVQSVEIDPLTLVKGLALGMGAAVLATIAPALEATLVPPRLALARSNIEERIRRLLPWTVGAGVALIAVACLVLWFGGRSIVASFGGVLLVVLGVAALTPSVTVALMSILQPLGGRLVGPLGRMAPRTVTRALSRTSVAIAALMVAVSVTIGVGIMIASFRQTVDTWLGMTLKADIYVSTPSLTATRNTGVLDPVVAAELPTLAGVQEVELVRNTTVDTNFGPSNLVAVKGTRPRDLRVYKELIGTPDEMWAQVQSGAAIISEPYAYRHNLGLNSSVTLQTGQGDVTVRIVGVYYDYASDQGTIMVGLRQYQHWFGDPTLSSAAIYVQPDVNVDQLVQTLRTRYASRDIIVSPNAALRRAALIIFDRTFAITSALQLLATVVAFIGVLSALMALQLERTRELGTLRATGMTLEQMWGLTLLESGLMGGVAGLVAAPTGLALAFILVYIINLRSFGWTLQLLVQPGLFVQAFLVAVAAALLAALYPALRLSRLQVAEALRSE